MYAPQPKKLLIMNILDILKKYTDENHRLSQREISDILWTEYNMRVDRKAVKRNLMDLIDCGYEIEYSESRRRMPNRKTGELEEEYILSDFYLVREFTDGELRLLIDSLLFSKHIPYKQCKTLVQKLEGLSNRYFQSHVAHVHTLPDERFDQKQFFYTIEVLDEAIERERQVAFHYGELKTDKKLHLRKNRAGEVREYIVNPYQIVGVNGRYYLICNNDKYDEISNYRVERIVDIRLLDTPWKPFKKVKGLENGFDLPRHMAEHIYMFTGPSETVTFQLKKYLVGEVLDWFGKEIVFFDETDEDVSARVHVNCEAMRKWALQYALHVKVLSPPALVDQVKEDIETSLKNYSE